MSAFAPAFAPHLRTTPNECFAPSGVVKAGMANENYGQPDQDAVKEQATGLGVGRIGEPSYEDSAIDFLATSQVYQ